MPANTERLYSPSALTPRRARLSPRAAFAFIASVSLALWTCIGLGAAVAAMVVGIVL